MAPFLLSGKTMNIISTSGLRALMKSEEFRADAYPDSAGIWTIGYGTTRINGFPVKKGDRITEAAAMNQLSIFCASLVKDINAVLGNVPTKQCEMDAFVNLAYNIGGPAFLKSTALKRHIAGDRAGCAEAIKMWDKATVNGKKVVLKGLTARRQREVEMYLNGIYKV